MKHFLFGIFAAVCLSSTATAQGYSELTDARDALLEGDYEAAFSVIEPAAEAGNLRAMNLLGAAIKDGLGQPQDTALALALFKKAAASNYGPALFNLGLTYDTGAPGLEPDPALAREYYLRGVELDFAPTMSAFARLMLVQGADDEMPLVIDVLERGVVRGDPRSLLILGFLMRQGQGVPADPARARDLLLTAALLGERDAMFAVAEMFSSDEGGAPDPETGQRFLRALAEAGDAEAIAWLAE